MTVEEQLARTRRPTIGRIVVYRSRTGEYDVPAIITATVETLVVANVAKGLLPGLSSAEHVHLTVFTPGQVDGDAAFLVESEHGRSQNQGGTYQEWNIEWSEVPQPGTWRWPTLT